MFTKGSDLKNCLISKGWKNTITSKKGSISFMIIDTNDVKIITSDKADLIGRVTYCTHTPDRCDAKQSSFALKFYSL